MPTKVTSTPAGSSTDTSAEARRCISITRTTMIVISSSSVSALSSVAIVSSIRIARS